MTLSETPVYSAYLLYAHFIYAVAWLSFGMGHSVLASATVKDRLVPRFGPAYRLLYNAFAALHILSVWLVGNAVFAGIATFTLPQLAGTVLSGVSILGWIILILALRSYDLGRLIGAAQIRNHRAGIDAAEDEALNTAGFHAYVRHPVYSGAYLILWGGAQDDFGLATALWGSAYLAIGTFFEERRLLALYGMSYRSYRLKVPSIVPWRGKVI